MFNFIMKLFYTQASFLPPNTSYVKDQIHIRFLTACENDITIKNWIKNRNIEKLCNLNLFKEIITKIRDTLNVIKTERYVDVKSLITNSNINFYDVCYLYYEAFNIIDSLKRIIWINDIHNISMAEKYNNLEFIDEIIFEEYDRLYYNLERTIVYVGLKYNLTENNESFIEWIRKRLSQKIKFVEPSVCVYENLQDTLELIKISRNTLELILPIDYEISIYVKANSKGFKSSIKCFNDKNNLFIREKHTMIVSSSNTKQYPIECLRQLSIRDPVNILDYMDRTFLCNKTTTELLIILFHFYSELKGVNTMYELIRKKDDEYQVRWSVIKNPSLEAIKEYWLRQEIPDLPTRKIIHKFGLIVDYVIQYSTKKSEDTEDEPIITRLILLSCGHQLGFELIDEFLEYFYVKYDNPLECHICKHPITIVGSYNAVVYKCK